MMKVVFAFMLGIGAFAAAKLGSVQTSGQVQARAASFVAVSAEPAIDPSALTRAAPGDLPTENWNPI